MDVFFSLQEHQPSPGAGGRCRRQFAFASTQGFSDRSISWKRCLGFPVPLNLVCLPLTQAPPWAQARPSSGLRVESCLVVWLRPSAFGGCSPLPWGWPSDRPPAPEPAPAPPTAPAAAAPSRPFLVSCFCRVNPPHARRFLLPLCRFSL